MIKLLKENEVAEILGLSVQTLQLWRAKNVGVPFVKISPKCVRYRISDIEQYIEQQRVEPEALKNGE